MKDSESDPTMKFHVLIGGDDEMYVTRKASEVKDQLSDLKVGQGWLSPDESAHWVRIK